MTPAARDGGRGMMLSGLVGGGDAVQGVVLFLHATQSVGLRAATGSAVKQSCDLHASEGLGQLVYLVTLHVQQVRKGLDETDVGGVRVVPEVLLDEQDDLPQTLRAELVVGVGDGRLPEVAWLAACAYLCAEVAEDFGDFQGVHSFRFDGGSELNRLGDEPATLSLFEQVGFFCAGQSDQDDTGNLGVRAEQVFDPVVGAVPVDGEEGAVGALADDAGSEDTRVELVFKSEGLDTGLESRRGLASLAPVPLEAGDVLVVHGLIEHVDVEEPEGVCVGVEVPERVVGVDEDWHVVPLCGGVDVADASALRCVCQRGVGVIYSSTRKVDTV